MTEQAADIRASRYQLRKQLQTSATGAVWRGWDEVMSRAVDVRQLRPPAQLAPEQQRAVVAQQARAAVRARGALFTGLVPVFDVLASDDEVLVVSDAVEGSWLSAALRDSGPVQPDRAAAIAERLATTLEALHAEGLVHGDLRPSRVRIDGDNVWLVAYGLERSAENNGGAMLLASPAYLSPQRARGGAPAPADDVWALGALTYAMIEGTPPFSGHSVDDVLRAITAGPPPASAASPPALAELVTSMLAPEPADRHDAATVRRRLQAVRSAPPTAARHSGGDDPAGDVHDPWSHDLLIPLVGILVVLVITAVLLSRLL